MRDSCQFYSTVVVRRFLNHFILFFSAFQGDIRFAYDAKEELLRNAINDNDRRWPNAMVPYEIDPEYTNDE